MNVNELESWIRDEITQVPEGTPQDPIGGLNDEPRHEAIDYPSGTFAEKSIDTFDPIQLIAQANNWRDNLKLQCREYLNSNIPIDTLIHLVDELDYMGLLNESDESLAKTIKINSAEVAYARKVLRSFSPGGFALPTLPDFYMFQLESMGLLNRGYVALLSGPNLSYIEESRFDLVCSQLGIDEATLKEKLNVLKMLRPYPSHGLETGDPVLSPTRPDIIIHKQNDELFFHLEESTSIEDSIASLRLRRARGSHFKRLERISRAVHRRRLTIIAVVERILFHQQDYFLGHRTYPKRLTRRMIAAETGRHESTIGRAIANKWVDWQGQLSPLHRLISDRDDSGDNGRVPHDIKDAIEIILRTEDRAKPYSDQKISTLLREQGFQVARRTVAAYRNSLNIPSAQVRRWHQ